MYCRCGEDISDLDVGDICENCDRRITRKMLKDLDGLSDDTCCYQCDGSDPECPVCGSTRDD